MLMSAKDWYRKARARFKSRLVLVSTLCTYSLSPEWFPDNCAILDCVFSVAAGGYDSALANVDHIHYTDHEVVSRASTFLLLIESGNKVLAHIGSEVRRVQGDHLGLFFEEEHVCGGSLRSICGQGSWGGSTRRDCWSKEGAVTQLANKLWGGGIGKVPGLCATQCDAFNRGLTSTSLLPWPDDGVKAEENMRLKAWSGRN